MTIGTRITIGIGLSLAILVVIGFLSYDGLIRLRDANRSTLETNRHVAHTHEVLGQLEAFLSALKDAETGQRGYLLTGEEPYLDPHRAALGQIDENLKHLRTLTADNALQQRRLDAIAPLVSKKLAELKETIDLRKSKGFEAAAEVVKTDRGMKVMDELRKLSQEMRATEEELLARRNAEAEASAQAAEATARSAIFMLVVGVSVLCVLVILGGWLLVRSVTGPVREAIGRLTSTNAELLASVQQQASSAQEQAAAVAQTVTTVDEVMQTADQTAERARAVGDAFGRTLEVGKSGRRAAEQSAAALGTVQGQVEGTASNILALAEQAQAIGDIIATVNDIAEQTNLLALNAAIEASRAGEHGRGFAVVAGEVKALADQSRKATGQVRQILGQIQKATNTAVLSTEEVTRGVATASQVATGAGETIASLADALGETARSATQIVASAGQQATGMAQIHQAMRSLDEVARQNLASTRQVEQAARDLNVLGTQLGRLIGK
jgi:methyl-accepting chemotaxis protein